jgi:hypothetical protein
MSALVFDNISYVFAIFVELNFYKKVEKWTSDHFWA